MFLKTFATSFAFTFQQSTPKPTSMQIIRGKDAVVEQRAMLMRFAAHCGQVGAADYLEYFLTNPYVGAKTPCLALVHDAETEKLRGTVLLYEYRVRGLATGVFVTDDDAGDRTVLARAEDRLLVASEVSEHLIRAGARLVLLSFRSNERVGMESWQAGRQAPPLRWKTRERVLRLSLSLKATYDETIAPMGKHTRRNLRASQRRAEADLQAQFVPMAEISLDDFVALNRLCSYPVPDHVSAWRYENVAKLTGGFLMGVRSVEGKWLSLLGGRRHHGRTEIGWQMNLASMKAYSLSNVMRSYLIEHEVSLGAHTIFFEGGTPQSMQSAFREDRVIDLLVSSKSLSTSVLRRLAPRLLPTKNPLSQMLCNQELDWSEQYTNSGAIAKGCSALLVSVRQIWGQARSLFAGSDLEPMEQVNG